MIRQKFCVNKKLVERWKKSLNSRDIPEAAAAASTGCASLSRLSATMQQCSLWSCSTCTLLVLSFYVPCTVVQTVTTSTWYTEHCKVWREAHLYISHRTLKFWSNSQCFPVPEFRAPTVFSRAAFYFDTEACSTLLHLFSAALSHGDLPNQYLL